MSDDLKTINSVVTKDLGDGYIKVVLIIDNKYHEYRLKRQVAVSFIQALAGSLDGDLHIV
jgi:hypothetical protein